ncbi:hypothetical protein BGZ94_004822 [Podila epigama]|nr:hypothetical protein BGZ94_004822 [Podila epigama]
MTTKLSDRFSNPKAIDPSHILSFVESRDLSTAIDAHQEYSFSQHDKSLFLDSFQKCFRDWSELLQSLGTTSLHIIQQPKPAKLRGRYIEVKDIRKLCHLGEHDAIIMVLIPNCPPPPVTAASSSSSDSSCSLASSPSSESLSATSTSKALDPMSGDASMTLDGHGKVKPKSTGGTTSVAHSKNDELFEYYENIQILSHSTSSQMYISQPCPPPEPSLPFHQDNYLVGSPIPVAPQEMSLFQNSSDHQEDKDDNDDDGYDDDYGDETDDLRGNAGMFRRFQRRRKKSAKDLKSDDSLDDAAPSSRVRRERKWFRPLVEGGEIQFEIWVAAFLKAPHKNGLDARTNGVSSQRDYSQWVQHVTEFLESRCVQAFIRWEVSQGGTIGINYREMMRIQDEEKRAARRRTGLLHW